jgi:hypothetical protein
VRRSPLYARSPGEHEAVESGQITYLSEFRPVKTTSVQPVKMDLDAPMSDSAREARLTRVGGVHAGQRAACGVLCARCWVDAR